MLKGLLVPHVRHNLLHWVSPNKCFHSQRQPDRGQNLMNDTPLTVLNLKHVMVGGGAALPFLKYRHQLKDNAQATKMDDSCMTKQAVT